MADWKVRMSAVRTGLGLKVERWVETKARLSDSSSVGQMVRRLESMMVENLGQWMAEVKAA